MITDNLTNTVFFSAKLAKKCPKLNAHIATVLHERNIPFRYLAKTEDIWCRDFMPIQIEKDRFVTYEYTPDYLQDKVGIRIQTNANNVLNDESNGLFHLKDKTIKLDLVLDGGNVVKCGDVVVMTEKVFYENKNKTRAEVEACLHDAFQSEILFLPWDRNGDNWGLGHSDGIVHYAGKGRILLTNYDDFSIYYYHRFRKKLESRFEVIPMAYKAKRWHARSWAYINFLQIGNVVFVPQIELEEDEQAIEQIKDALHDCEVIGIPALEAVRRDGALNCISWNICI